MCNAKAKKKQGLLAKPTLHTELNNRCLVDLIIMQAQYNIEVIHNGLSGPSHEVRTVSWFADHTHKRNCSSPEQYISDVRCFMYITFRMSHQRLIQTHVNRN